MWRQVVENLISCVFNGIPFSEVPGLCGLAYFFDRQLHVFIALWTYESR